ncbi:MAG TPA: hypothetical protein VH479_06540 [Acidimicrobiales bacterium]
MVARDDRQPVAEPQRSAGQRARDDGARAAGDEGAVDPEAGTIHPGRRSRGRQVLEGGAQGLDPDALRGVHGDDRGAGEEGPGHALGDLGPGGLAPVVVDQADLGQRDDAVGHTDQVEDLQVLLGLGLPALARVHDEQAGVDHPDAGEHVLDEAGVAGHVHEGQVLPGRQRRPGEAEVDSQPACLLLGQAVGIHAGERLDQGRLAVVDVARGGDDAHAATRRRRRARRPPPDRPRARRSAGPAASRRGGPGR